MNSRIRGLRLIVATGLTTVLVPGVAAAQLGTPADAGPRTIRVAGTGEVQAAPDLATIQFAVETTGTTAREAGEANATLMDQVIQALIGAGVDRSDISTSGYSLYPDYAEQPRDGDAGPPRIRGYRARNQVAVETGDLDGVGALIDAGLAAGANRLNGISFKLRDSDAAEAEALERAVMDARSAAETMANALGVQLGPVIDASTSSTPVQPYFRAVARESMAMAAPTPIEPGEQTVRASASLVFAIE